MRIPCKYLLFDLDGTLVDSTRKISDCWRAWAIDRNLDPEKVELFSRGKTAKETISLILPTEADIDNISNDFVENEIKQSVDLSSILHASELLSSISPAQWGIVTSATNRLAKARLASAGLPIPTLLISSESVEKGKPAPDGYIAAAQSLGVNPNECLVFEDSQTGIQAAIDAGMMVVQISRQEAFYGATCAIDDYEKVRVEENANGLSVVIES